MILEQTAWFQLIVWMLRIQSGVQLFPPARALHSQQERRLYGTKLLCAFRHATLFGFKDHDIQWEDFTIPTIFLDSLVTHLDDGERVEADSGSAIINVHLIEF